MKDRIKQIRQYFGLTQEKFGDRINKTAGFISSVENGRSRLSSDTIKIVCNIFGVDEDWLKDGIGEMFVEGSEKAPADISGIGKRIKEIRTINGLTQEQFGNKIGFHKNHVYYVENGKYSPSDDFLISVGTAFGVSYNWLLNGDESKKTFPVDNKMIDWLWNHESARKKIREWMEEE